MPSREVNLALGGGGAKGFVHVGVIEELVEQGFEIKSIVGTSIGALVGALFAHGVAVQFRNEKPAERQRRAAARVRSLLHAQDFRSFVDVDYLRILRRGVLRGKIVEEWLTTKLYNTESGKPLTFADLDFDLTITVTDVLTGNCHHLARDRTATTDVSRAVRASISVPVIFQDVTVTIGENEVRCWDGGTTGNCRFDLAHGRDPSRLTVASSITYAGADPKLESIFGFVRAAKAFNHVLDILMRRVEDAMADQLGDAVMKDVVVVRPDLDGVGTLDFRIDRRRRERLAANGREAMRKELHKRAAATE